MSQQDSSLPKRKADERIAVAFLTLAFFPLLAIVGIGGYGFLIWVSQMIFGPQSF